MLGSKVFDKYLWQLITIFLKSFLFQNKVNVGNYVKMNRKNELSFYKVFAIKLRIFIYVKVITAQM